MALSHIYYIIISSETIFFIINKFLTFPFFPAQFHQDFKQPHPAQSLPLSEAPPKKGLEPFFFLSLSVSSSLSSMEVVELAR